MRIALLSWESLHSIRVGGIAPHVTELAAALERRGHNVHVFTRIGEGQARYDRIDGVHYHRCPFHPDPDFVTSMGRMSESLAWHLGEVEAGYGVPFDVVHGHDWLVAKGLCQLKNDRHRPVVLTVHSTEYGRCGNELFWHGESQRIREIEWEATYIANRVICVSESLRKEVQSLYTVPSDKIVPIYNGVDVRPFDAHVDVPSIRARHAIGVDDPCILFAGRLAWQKGPDLLVEAMPRVLRKHPQAKFVFVGEGDMRADLEAQVGAARSTPAARFVGYRKGIELIGLFKSADVVCVPSRNEPFGIVILEAWSASKPVVATRIGGPAEFVRHEDTGLTVSGDASSIGDGVGVMLSDVANARRMGLNGRREAETRFSWDTIAAQTEAVYLSMNGRDSPHPASAANSTKEITKMAQQTGRTRTTNAPATRRPFGSPEGSTRRGGTCAATSAFDGKPTAEEIRCRAYEIYLARDGAPGDPNADWLQAERELRDRRQEAES